MKIMKKLMLIIVFILLSNLTFSQDKEEQYPLATIYPHQIYGHTINHFFLDLKGRENKISTRQEAKLFFQNEDMDGIRINIHGEKKKPAHPESGVVDSTYYTTMLQSIRNAKAARGDKPFYVFASKKLDGKTSFPSWVKDNNGIIPEKYVELLMDYLKFMKEKNINVDYLGIDNETNFNEGNITPEKFNEIVNLLREKCENNNITFPKIVGPDRYEPMGERSDCWIKLFMDAGYGDQLDIYGTHYYPNHRYYDKLTYELGLIGDRPFWSTELHWDSASNTGSAYNSAEQAICTLWDQTDNGLNAFMWWGNGLGYICQEFSAPIHGSQPCKMEDFDGESTTEYGKLQTRSFINGNTLEIYVINNNSRIINSAPFKVDSATISGDVTATQFTENGSESGYTNTIKPVTNNVFLYKIDANSFIHFTVPLTFE